MTKKRSEKGERRQLIGRYKERKTKGKDGVGGCDAAGGMIVSWWDWKYSGRVSKTSDLERRKNGGKEEKNESRRE